MVLLGGSRRLMGPLVGAIIVGFLPGVLDVAGIGLTPFQRQIVFGAMLIAVIILLPYGLVQGIADLYGYAKRLLAAHLGLGRGLGPRGPAPPPPPAVPDSPDAGANGAPMNGEPVSNGAAVASDG